MRCGGQLLAERLGFELGQLRRVRTSKTIRRARRGSKIEPVWSLALERRCQCPAQRVSVLRDGESRRLSLRITDQQITAVTQHHDQHGLGQGSPGRTLDSMPRCIL